MFPAHSFCGGCSLLISLWLVAAAAGDDPPVKRPPGSKGPPVGRGEARGGPELPGPFRLPPHIQLTPEQQRALQDIHRELGPRWQALEEDWHTLMTEELRAAERAAREEARRQGLRGPQEREFIEAALPLTAEQRDIRATLEETRKQLDQEVTARIRVLLTPEQRAAAGPRFRAKGEKPVPPPRRGAAPDLPHRAAPVQPDDDRDLDNLPTAQEDRRVP